LAVCAQLRRSNQITIRSEISKACAGITTDHNVSKFKAIGEKTMYFLTHQGKSIGIERKSDDVYRKK